MFAYVAGCLHLCTSVFFDIIFLNFFFFQAEDGIRDVERSRGLGDVYKRQAIARAWVQLTIPTNSPSAPTSLISVSSVKARSPGPMYSALIPCLLYTSDAADDTPCVDLGGRRIIKKKKYEQSGCDDDDSNNMICI
eukprot:TRINITY_DN6294_c0_g1_i5.p1 TRINITY_DN6294_c0_g1~~TRINITY_DN6294_c0_g1_i5.p1  ORF type:complete len:136 (-),score=30.22 TRINITY_DN6294_c0_g1_i5:48-455(-)